MNTILNSIHVAGNVLLHSIRTATFCWVAVGLVMVFMLFRRSEVVSEVVV